MVLRRCAADVVRVNVAFPSIDSQLKDIELTIAQVATGSMQDAVDGLKGELRGQIIEAGMGQRLANTWRGDVYPKAFGKVSMNPAGYVRSLAPLIVDAFTRGATIKPINGSKYIWIPTKNVPRRRRAGTYRSNMSRRSGGGAAMSPEECELHFNTEFFVRPGRQGSLLAFMDLTAGLNIRRAALRRDTAGRRKQGRKAKPVLMFTLRKTVTLRRLFDVEGPANRWGAKVPALFEARWR
ncbi:DUF6441 family protein [Sphingobium aromaticiconvertens]|uniref:DUF6441 family protein n=1 Tax=Sphingobium aromaticiconvertens TaxID=365341 RepID=UPI00301979C4